MSKHKGNPDSKYAYAPEQLEIDIHNKLMAHKACREAIKAIVLDNPANMQERYYDVIDALKELREEYGL